MELEALVEWSLEIEAYSWERDSHGEYGDDIEDILDDIIEEIKEKGDYDE